MRGGDTSFIATLHAKSGLLFNHGASGSLIAVCMQEWLVVCMQEWLIGIYMHI